MDEQRQNMKTALIDTFNTVSDGYDSKALRFFSRSAEHMASLLGLRGNESVLDVACGTGNASLAVARLLPKGRVTGLDFSSGMLEQARKKAASSGIGNVEFLERDMRDPGYEGRFDVAICAFGIFFVEDMDAQLARIASTVKPGGRIMISSFQDGYFQPLRDRLFERIAAYGVQDPPQAWRKRVENEAGCRELFEKAGLRSVRVESKNVGYFLDGPDEWWEIVWNAGFRRLLSRLSPEDQERFKEEHLSEIETLRTKEGIWLDTRVLYTMGTKK